MIEVLITMVIAAFGLLGIAALQAKMQLAEMESYQRSHATLLVRHIADRLNANRKNGLEYVTPEPLGTDKGVLDCTGESGAALDLSANGAISSPEPPKVTPGSSAAR